VGGRARARAASAAERGRAPALAERKEWKFFGRSRRRRTPASPPLGGRLSCGEFAIAMGVVAAVQRGGRFAGPLAFAGAIFVLLQVLSPIHQAVSANFGGRTAAWGYDPVTEACLRPRARGTSSYPGLSPATPPSRATLDPGDDGPPRLRVSLAKRRAGAYHQLERGASAHGGDCLLGRSSRQNEGEGSSRLLSWLAWSKLPLPQGLYNRLGEDWITGLDRYFSDAGAINHESRGDHALLSCQPGGHRIGGRDEILHAP